MSYSNGSSARQRGVPYLAQRLERLAWTGAGVWRPAMKSPVGSCTSWRECQYRGDVRCVGPGLQLGGQLMGEVFAFYVGVDWATEDSSRLRPQCRR